MRSRDLLIAQLANFAHISLPLFADQRHLSQLSWRSFLSALWAALVNPNKACRRKQSLFGKELQYTSVTSCIIQLQPTSVGRKGLGCVILPPPQAQTLFKICTTRILHYFSHPAHTLLLWLCPALPDTVATQCSVHYLFQSLNSLLMYLSPLSFPLSQRKAGFYFALVLNPKISWTNTVENWDQNIGTDLGGSLGKEHGQQRTAPVSLEQPTIIQRGLLPATEILPQKM